MALSTGLSATAGATANQSGERVTRARARDLATAYLIDEVGCLTSTGDASKVAGRWRFPILLGNAIQGSLGQVGMIEVDAENGHIELLQSYEEMLANAERLTCSST